MVKCLARGFFDADLRHRAGDNQRLNRHFPENIVQPRIVKCAVTELIDDGVASERREFVDDRGALQCFVYISVKAFVSGNIRRLRAPGLRPGYLAHQLGQQFVA